MDLFKRSEPLVTSGLPEQYIAIVDTQAVELPTVDWANIVVAENFVQLVTPGAEGQVTIWAVRDEDEALRRIRLIADNPAVCGVQIVRVSGLTEYAPSLSSEQAFWNCPVIQFEDWVAEAQEAAREAELASRASLDRDETKKDDAMRADGTFKKQVVTEVPDEPEMELVL